MQVRWIFTSVLGLGLVLVAPRASAEPNEAEASFRRGKALMNEGRLDEACAMFEASFSAESRLGSLLNLAECNARRDRLATALAQFRDVLRRADEQLAGKPEEGVAAQKRLATTRIAALAPRVPHIQITGAEATTDLTIAINSVPTKDLDIAVDFGRHRILVERAGFVAQTFEVVVSEERKVYPVALRAFEPVPAAELPAITPVLPVEPPPAPVLRPAQPPPQENIVTPQPRRSLPWPYVVTGIGVAATAAGLGFGLVARSRWNRAHADGHCDASERCDRYGLDTIHSAYTAGHVSSVLVGTGVVTIGLGVWWWLRERRGSRDRITLVPSVSARDVALVIAGTL
jgi:hypothetical protein